MMEAMTSLSMIIMMMTDNEGSGWWEKGGGFEVMADVRWNTLHSPLSTRRTIDQIQEVVVDAHKKIVGNITQHHKYTEQEFILFSV